MPTVQPSTKPLKGLSLGLAFVFAIPLLLTGCSEQPDPADTAAYHHKVETNTLKRQQGFTIPRRFVGRVHAREQAGVGFEFAGKIEQVAVDEGEQIIAGQLLATLDTQLLLLQDEQLAEQYRQNEADLQLALNNLKRLQSLESKGYTSEQSVDELTTRRSALNATLKRIASLRESNQTQREKSRLLAPFNGTVSHRHISPGEVLNPGAPAFSLLKNEAEVKVGIPLRLRSQLKAQKQFSITIAGQPMQAQLVTKGVQVDPVTHTIQLRLGLAEEQDLYDGQLAYLHMEENLDQAGFWVPLTALADGMRGMWNLYILVPDDSGLYRIERRDIRVHYADQWNAYVDGAIADGEQVVAAGVHRVAAGQIVRTDSQRLLAERAQ